MTPFTKNCFNLSDSWVSDRRGLGDVLSIMDKQLTIMRHNMSSAKYSGAKRLKAADVPANTAGQQ